VIGGKTNIARSRSLSIVIHYSLVPSTTPAGETRELEIVLENQICPDEVTVIRIFGVQKVTSEEIIGVV